MATRWSDAAFLDEIRRHVDPQADACVARVFTEGAAAGSAALFRHTTSNDDQLPEGSPPALVGSSGGAALRRRAPTSRVARGGVRLDEERLDAALVLLAECCPRAIDSASRSAQILEPHRATSSATLRGACWVAADGGERLVAGGFAANGKASTPPRSAR
jgi:hypothetical protein